MIRKNLSQKTTVTAPVFSISSQSAGTVDSTAVANNATQDYEDGMLLLVLGAATGTPTTMNLTVTLQDSITSGGTYAASAGGQAAAAITVTAIPGAGGASYKIPFSATALRSFRRWEAVLSFTGGSSPAIPITALEVLGGAQKTSTP